MVLAAMLTIVLAQATLVAAQTPLFTDPEATPRSPPPSMCPPTDVKRIRPTSVPDPEFHGSAKWCTGNSCYVEEVVVTVNPDGTVKSAAVRHSWGVGPDDAALTAARNSKYIAATVNCKPVQGTYVFREMFTEVH